MYVYELDLNKLDIDIYKFLQQKENGVVSAKGLFLLQC